MLATDVPKSPGRSSRCVNRDFIRIYVYVYTLGVYIDISCVCVYICICSKDVYRYFICVCIKKHIVVVCMYVDISSVYFSSVCI